MTRTRTAGVAAATLGLSLACAFGPEESTDDAPPPKAAPEAPKKAKSDDGKPKAGDGQWGTAKNDVAWAVAAHGDAVYVVGATDFKPDKVCDTQDNEQAWIQRLDAETLKVEWMDHFGSSEADQFRYVAVNDVGVFAIGRTNGEIDARQAPPAGDFFVRRYSHDGTLEKSRQLGSKRMEEALDLVIYGDHLYISGGTTGDMCAVLKAACSRSGKEDNFVAKLDMDLEVVAFRQFGTPQFEEATGIAVDDKSVYLAGATKGKIGDRMLGGGGDAFVVRLNHDLEIQEKHQFGSAGKDMARDVAVWKGAVYVVGHTQGDILPEGGYNGDGDSDAYLYRAPFNGKKAWVQHWGDNDDSEIASRVIADDEGVFVVGTGGILGKHVCEPTNKDGNVRQFSHKGERGWRTEVKCPSDQDDLVRGVAMGAGSLFVVGTTSGVLGSENFGGYDGFLRRLDPASGKVR